MKHIKKIFLSVLIVAMLVSVLAVVASAQALNVTGESVSDVLEYYTNTTVSESFENLITGTPYATVAPGALEFDAANSTATAEVVEVDGEKAIKLVGASTQPATGDFYFVSDVESGAKGFGVDFSYRPNEGGIKNSRGTTTYGIFTIYAVPADGGDPIALVEINPANKANKVSVLNKTDDGAGGFVNALTAIEGVTVTHNVRYEVSYYYNFADNQYTLTVTAIGATLGEMGSTYTYTGSYAEPLNVAAVKSGFAASGWYNAKNINYIYSYRAYNGSFAQLAVCEKVHAKVAEYIPTISNIFADANTTSEKKGEIVDVVAEIVGSYGFTSEDANVNSMIDTILLDAQKVWGASFVAAIPSLDDTAPYAERLEFVNSISKFYNVVADKTEIDGIDATALAAAKEAYVAEVTMLENIVIDSNALIALMDGVVIKNLDYLKLDEYNTAIEAIENADPTYNEQTLNAVILALDLCIRYEEVCELNSTFIESVETMQKTDIVFAEKYSAYAFARDAYADLDESYPGVVAAADVYDAFDATAIVALEVQFEELIAEISKADFATTFTAIQTFIDNATLLFDNAELEAVNFSYPEMEEYKALYEEIKLSQDTKKAAADAYIAAVNAIKSLTKFDDIKAAVAAAQALKATGNISGIEGIDEANVYLSEKYTEIVCYEGYSKLYIETVNAIKDAKTLAERRALLIEAAEYVGGTYADYNGVSAAKTEYAAQFAAYNEAVKAANTAFNTVVTTAADAVASPATAKLNRVALVVKKFFE